MTAPISPAAQRTAQAALEEARPIIARLDLTRHPEEVAADLIDAWTAVETSLRALIGGSSLGGQALIRDLRARQIITFDQANGLAQFQAARERAQRTDYKPAETDLEAARDGFFKIQAALQQHAASLEMMPPGMTPLYTPALAEQMTREGFGAPGAPLPPAAAPARRARPRWLVPLLAGLVMLALAGGAWAFLASRSSNDDVVRNAIALYGQGQRERAASEFQRAARMDSSDATPHIFLSRMARDVGNLALARDEASAAIRADAGDSRAHREMGSVLFTMGNYDVARNFYIRAITLNDQDRTAMGFLGCTMLRLGRFEDARKWLDRAGPGDWSACARALPPAGYPGQPAGAPPQGASPQQPAPGYPQGAVPQQPPSGEYIRRTP